MNYNIDYFIEKFDAIPSREWCEEDFETSDGQKCALGHCGYKFVKHGIHVAVHGTKEGVALRNIFSKYKLDVANVNDNCEWRFRQRTPKSRILAALRFIKKQACKK